MNHHFPRTLGACPYTCVRVEEGAGSTNGYPLSYRELDPYQMTDTTVSAER